MQMYRTVLSILFATLLTSTGPSVYAQGIRVISPNGGEQWTAGTTQTVQWEAINVDQELEVEFTTDGSQWRRIARVQPGTTQLSWLIDNRPSTAARVRVITKDESVSDESDAGFTILEDPLDRTLLRSPNGGEVWTSGEQHVLTWQLPLDAVNASLEFSTNFGVSWQPIATIPATQKEYSWTIPAVPNEIATAVARVSVTEAPDHFDISDQAFTIRPVVRPSILLTYPNGGEKLEGGNATTVRWQAANLPGGTGPEMRLQFSLDRGISWTEITRVDARTGQHLWNVPNVATTTALLRIVSASLSDTTDASFSIAVTGDPALTLLSPNGGEIWKEGELHDIRWINGSNEGEVRVYLVLDPQDTKRKELLATLSPSVEMLTWTVPILGKEPVQAVIEVESGSETVRSSGSFTILPDQSLSVGTLRRGGFEMQAVYPNPSSQQVTLTWAPPTKGAAVLRLLNSAGEIVRTTSVSAQSSSLQLEVHDLPQGAYFYELRTDGHIARGALTILR